MSEVAGVDVPEEQPAMTAAVMTTSHVLRADRPGMPSLIGVVIDRNVAHRRGRRAWRVFGSMLGDPSAMLGGRRCMSVSKRAFGGIPM